jgi:hypothetical protein
MSFDVKELFDKRIKRNRVLNNLVGMLVQEGITPINHEQNCTVWRARRWLSGARIE